MSALKNNIVAGSIVEIDGLTMIFLEIRKRSNWRGETFICKVFILSNENRENSYRKHFQSGKVYHDWQMFNPSLYKILSF